MRWKRLEVTKGVYAEHTLCSEHGYCVLRCTDNGVVTGRYVSFLVQANQTRVVLGGYDSAEDAKRACEVHFMQTRGVAA